MNECARCGSDIEEQAQPAGSGYGWIHAGSGSRFCSGSGIIMAKPKVER